MKAVFGTKIGMTQILHEDGALVPVTLVQVSPSLVTQIKTLETDGYSAVQLGAKGLKTKKVSKSVAGHATKTDKNFMPSIIREVRTENIDEELKAGSSFDVSVFEVGDTVKVTGRSKGKGFAGNVKRHNFNTSKKTHGGNGYVRRPGSIGSMYPQKVFKGKRMAGQMGAEKVTISGLEVAYVDSENNVLGLKGSIPGPRKSTVMVVGA